MEPTWITSLEVTLMRSTLGRRGVHSDAGTGAQARRARGRGAAAGLAPALQLDHFEVEGRNLLLVHEALRGDLPTPRRARSQRTLRVRHFQAVRAVDPRV